MGWAHECAVIRKQVEGAKKAGRRGCGAAGLSFVMRGFDTGGVDVVLRRRLHGRTVAFMPTTSKKRHERHSKRSQVGQGVVGISQPTRPNISQQKRYENLQAWCACHELVLAVYRASCTWPKSECYGLTSQCRRASVSAAANIAEGAGKKGYKEFARFLDISLGSLSEMSYLLRLVHELHYVSPAESAKLEILRDHAGRLTWGLLRSIRNP
jgi:four helix bundle protein